METFITIIYVIVAFMMVLAILLQAGKGGGLGSALGGGASQSVFGGGGGADFMAKLTQGFAATFMICAMYLAYASAHAGSEFLEGQDAGSTEMLDGNDEINFEALGINPQPLPTPEEGKAMQAKASALVPAQSEAEPGAEPGTEEAPTPEAVPEEGAEKIDNKVDENDRGDSPESERGDSPQNDSEGPVTGGTPAE
jgi:preprotein translocase subunit SecG